MMMILYFLLTLQFLIPQTEPKFEAQVLDDNVAIGYGLAIGDVDGDRKPDILLADKKQFVWYRNGDWKRFVMADDLTQSDNVCIAARDIDGDGKVEVAVGAQWNPGETSDTLKSGAAYYLVRPTDPTQQWMPVKLHHEPVTHRMRWARATANQYHLIVLPLHGRANKGGEGKGVRVFAYEMPADPVKQPWKLTLMDESMHMTHNLDVVPQGNGDLVYIGGKEGVKVFRYQRNRWVSTKADPWLIRGNSFGEVRATNDGKLIAGVEPMHGNELTVYSAPSGGSSSASQPSRTVLTSALNQGHALAVGDVLGTGNTQVVIGWREPDKDGKVGVKIFVPARENQQQWRDYWIDDNGMACEDLQVADLDGDGKPEVIAAGRASHNLKIYWNRN